MVYSVWNHATRAYDVYETSQVGPTHAEGAKRGRVTGPLGATPEDVAYRLPPGARKTGTSVTAKGRVATLGGDDDGLGGVLDGLPSWWPVAAAAAAYAIWRMR
jgi:hypothetical protein